MWKYRNLLSMNSIGKEKKIEEREGNSRLKEKQKQTMEIKTHFFFFEKGNQWENGVLDFSGKEGWAHWWDLTMEGFECQDKILDFDYSINLLTDKNYITIKWVYLALQKRICIWLCKQRTWISIRFHWFMRNSILKISCYKFFWKWGNFFLLLYLLYLLLLFHLLCKSEFWYIGFIYNILFSLKMVWWGIAWRSGRCWVEGDKWEKSEPL